MRGRVVHGQTARLRQRHDEERAEGEQMAGAERSRRDRPWCARRSARGWSSPRASASAKIASAIVGSASAATVISRLEPMPPKAEPGIEPGERQEEGAEQQQVDDHDQIADGVERRAAPRGSGRGRSRRRRSRRRRRARRGRARRRWGRRRPPWRRASGARDTAASTARRAGSAGAPSASGRGPPPPAPARARARSARSRADSRSSASRSSAHCPSP